MLHIITLKREACAVSSISLYSIYPKFTPFAIAQSWPRDASIYSPLLAYRWFQRTECTAASNCSEWQMQSSGRTVYAGVNCVLVTQAALPSAHSCLQRRMAENITQQFLSHLYGSQYICRQNYTVSEGQKVRHAF